VSNNDELCTQLAGFPTDAELFNGPKPLYGFGIVTSNPTFQIQRFVILPEDLLRVLFADRKWTISTEQRGSLSRFPCAGHNGPK
jgi:hypothetical protein